MTWVCAVSNVLGSCALFSDIQVTLANGDTADLIQKAYPLDHSIAAGFAGSVKIGFALLDSLADFLRLPPGVDPNQMGWDPCFVSRNWGSIARSVFEAADSAERRLGAQFLIVAASPNENRGFGPKIYFTRFASPEFKLGIMTRPVKFCSIGSGATIPVYNDTLRPLFRWQGHVYSLQADARGGPHGWARNLNFRISHRLANYPRKGISRHIHSIIIGRKLMIVENNDENIYPGDGPRIEIRMPPVAQSYKQFTALAASRGCDAVGAVC